MANKRIYTINGCFYTEPSVFPKNWKEKSADLNSTWYVRYNFYDPAMAHLPKYKYGKDEKHKGFAIFKTLKERQEAVKVMIEDIHNDLKVNRWNPITKTYMVPADEFEYEIHPDTNFIVALKEVATKLNYAESTKRDIKSILGRLPAVARELSLSQFKISEIRKRHVKSILNFASSIDGRYSAHRFNSWRTYLSMLFSELCEYETIEINPCREIKKAKTIVKIRKTLSIQERRDIDLYLMAWHYDFWRFVQIFFNSGARIIELLRIKVKDVNLREQAFKVLVKKGDSYREVLHVIKNNVIDLWKELLKDNPDPEAYVFGPGLKPEVLEAPIAYKNIERRWKTHVKKKLGIDADMYSLKHSHTDEVAALVGISMAAKHNAHSAEIAKRHYALGEDQRTKELIKALPVSLS